MYKMITRIFIKCFIFILIFGANNLYSQWINIFGFNLDDRATALATDRQGNVYVTGYVTSGSGNVDMCTIKYDALGIPQWTSPATYNGPGNSEDRAFGIVVDNDGNVIITGYSTGQGSLSDYTTIKYRATDGQQLWINRYNPPDNGEDRAFGIVVDRINNVYITGYISQLGTGNNINTMKLKSTDGQQIWGQPVVNPNINSEDRAFGIVVDSSGTNVYICGYIKSDTTGFDFTVASYDSSGVSRWINRFNGQGNFNDRAFGIVVDRAGENVYATGFSTSDTASGTDYATIKYNSLGDTQWVRRYNGSGNGSDRAFGIVVDNSGNPYITGFSTGLESRTDYVTIRYDSNGDSGWVQPFNGSGNFSDTAYGIFLGKNSQEVFVTGGASSDTIAGKMDIVTVKYNIETGEQTGEGLYNGPDNGYDMAVAVTADTSKNLFVAGFSQTNANGYDWFTTRYALGFIKVNMISTEVPKNFMLYQNYPNPFNPTTTIKFDITKASLVKLRIFDILGREVVVLVNQNLKVGSYEATFSSAKLASGLYFYELSADDYKEVKKMILVK